MVSVEVVLPFRVPFVVRYVCIAFGQAVHKGRKLTHLCWLFLWKKPRFISFCHTYDAGQCNTVVGAGA